MPRIIDVHESAMIHSRLTMIRKLFILAFVLSVAGNSLAAVLPCIEGDGGCSAKCCQAARQNRRDANVSKLRCIVDCNQSGTTNLPSPTVSVVAERDGKAGECLSTLRVAAAPSLYSAIALRSKNSLTTGSIDVYLRTRTLLI